MTYPVDDAGNPRIDFVWGNFPLQPDDQRLGRDTNNKYLNGDWLVSPTVGSSVLSTGWEEISRNTGDGYYQEISRYRADIVIYDSHEIATTGYSNYPSFIPNYSGDGDTGLEAKVPAVVTKSAAQAQSEIEDAGFVYASVTSTVGSTVDNDGEVKSQSPAANAIVTAGSTVTATLFLAPTVPNLVGLEDPTAAQEALAEVGLVLGDTNSSEDGANVGNDGTVKSQSVPAGTKVSGGSAVSIVVYDNPAVLVPNFVGMTVNAAFQAASDAGLNLNSQYTETGADSNNNQKVKSQGTAAGTSVAPGTTVSIQVYNFINYAVAGIRPVVGNDNRRFLYLRGRNSGIAQGNTIVLSDTGVTNYNRPFDVISVENDDAFNTGGQKIVIQNGLMDGTGGNVTDTGTWAFM